MRQQRLTIEQARAVIERSRQKIELSKEHVNSGGQLDSRRRRKLRDGGG